MRHQALSIRPFVGAKNFEESRAFYRDWGFEETTLGPQMSVFEADGLSFYLQNAYVKDWVDNTMLFLEVQDLRQYWVDMLALELPQKHPGVRVSPIQFEDWGREFFVHDPSGILWHIGEFESSATASPDGD
jgi:catechol 2,3-dioxygenase-like lactoylglutathione lyase family enzyme